VCAERGAGGGVGGGGEADFEDIEKALLFEKKKQKTSIYCGLWLQLGKRQQEQKFFASFFQKRSAFLR
jgi:hypothetical protein